jgi:alpha-N-acetylglucosamine transferase
MCATPSPGRRTNRSVKPIPILQIINLFCGILVLAWEWPITKIAGSGLHRSIEARLVLMPLFALAAVLAYDPYFTAVRVLTYQIIHNPRTRSKSKIPLLVLVTPQVPHYKHSVLASEGAIVVSIEPIRPSHNWLTPLSSRWEDQFSKLRVFGMTQYERILYLDSDMLPERTLAKYTLLKEVTRLPLDDSACSSLHQ